MIERRREEQALAALRRLVEQSLHRREEPEVGHEVGFVDDRHLDAVEAAVALADEVFEAAGACDEHVCATTQRVHLWALPGPTDHCGHIERQRSGERRQGVCDLVGQLSRGHEHERAGP